MIEYNSSVHQGTGETPYFLMYGVQPRNSFDINVLPNDLRDLMEMILEMKQISDFGKMD